MSVSFGDVCLLIFFYFKAKLLVLEGMLLNYHQYPSSGVKSFVLPLPSSVDSLALTFLLAPWVKCCQSLNQAHPEQTIPVPPEVEPVRDAINQLADPPCSTSTSEGSRL